MPLCRHGSHSWAFIPNVGFVKPQCTRAHTEPSANGQVPELNRPLCWQWVMSPGEPSCVDGGAAGCRGGRGRAAGLHRIRSLLSFTDPVQFPCSVRQSSNEATDTNRCSACSRVFISALHTATPPSSAQLRQAEFQEWCHGVTWRINCLLLAQRNTHTCVFVSHLSMGKSHIPT